MLSLSSCWTVSDGVQCVGLHYSVLVRRRSAYYNGALYVSATRSSYRSSSSLVYSRDSVGRCAVCRLIMWRHRQTSICALRMRFVYASNSLIVFGYIREPDIYSSPCVVCTRRLCTPLGFVRECAYLAVSVSSARPSAGDGVRVIVQINPVLKNSSL